MADSWIIGAMHQQLNQLITMQHDHAKVLQEISDKLDRLHLRPPKQTAFDLRDHLPLIWRAAMVAAVLFGFLKLPPEETSKLLFKLF